MQWKKRCAALLCAALTALGLAACGKQAGAGASSAPADGAPAGAAMGRWVERTALEFPAGEVPRSVARLDDGALVCWAVREQDYAPVRYVSADGGVTWQAQALPWMENVQGAISNIAQLPSGAAVLETYAPETGEVAYQLAQPDDAAPAPLAVPGLAQDERIVQLEPFSASQLFVAVGKMTDGGYAAAQRALLMDTGTGEKTADCDVSDFAISSASQPFTACAPIPGGQGAWLLGTGGDYMPLLARMDAAGEVQETVSPDVQSYISAAAADEDGGCWWLSTDGLSRRSASGTVTERVCEGLGYSFSEPSNTAISMAAAPDGSVLCVNVTMAGESMTGELTRYAYDETAPSAAQDTLRIWTLRSSNLVDAASAAYLQKHPEASVQVTAALEDGGFASAQDALRALNTELLAGQGPDVLILDGVDYASYIAQGLLEDLSGKVDADALQKQIRADFASEAMYVVPGGWTMPIVYGDTQDTEALTSLDAVCSAMQASPARPAMDMDSDEFYAQRTEAQRHAMPFATAQDVLDFAYDSSAPALLSGGAVDGQALRALCAFLEQAAACNDVKGRAYSEDYGAASQGDGAVMVTYLQPAYEYSFVHASRYGYADLAGVGYFTDMLLPQDAAGGELYLVPRPGLVQGAYEPNTLAGVSAASGNKDAAAEWVNLLLSDEVQTQPQNGCLPVTNAALDAQLALLEDGDYTVAYAGDVRAFLEQAQTPVTRDEAVYEKLLAHAARICDGDETADEAAAALQQELALYLAERQ